MEINPISFKETLGILAGSAIFTAAASYQAIKAWRMGIAEYSEFLRKGRPKSWQKWPIYGALWRSVDRSPKLYLWQNRILSVVGVLMGLLGLIVGISNLFRIIARG